MIININHNDINKALRSFLLEICTVDNNQVILGQNNRTALPIGNFIVFTPLFINRASNSWERTLKQSDLKYQESIYEIKEMVYQVDCYGNNAEDNVTIIEQVFKSVFGCDVMNNINNLITPLYSSKARQASMINSERQYQNRYSIDITLQPKQVVSAEIDTFDKVNFEIIKADEDNQL